MCISHFGLPVFDEVVLRQIGCSWAHKLLGYKDKLPNCREGAEGDIFRLFHARLADGSGSLSVICFVSVFVNRQD